MSVETQETKVPEIPTELWMLARDEDGGYVPAVDDPAGGENYLACLSEQDALASARHQAETYGLDCHPVRVKRGPAHDPSTPAALSGTRRQSATNWR